MFGGFDQPDLEIKPPKLRSEPTKVSKLFNFAHKLPFQKKLRHHVCGVNVHSVLSDLTMFVASYHPQCTILNPGSSQLDPQGHGVKANQWLAKKRTTCCKRFVSETFG